MKTPVFIDIFSSGLDELTRSQQADIATVLAVLDRERRYSVFEATDNQTIARTMDRIIDRELIAFGKKCAYPWKNCRMTKAGREWLKMHKPIERKQQRKQRKRTMNALRKATEHKRKPFRPVVSKAGRRVLESLAVRGERYGDEGRRQTWHASGGELMTVCATTIEALRNRGLVTVVPDQDGVVIVLLSPAGRKYLEETK